MAITDWPEDERPRERLLARGAGSLSDAELLAIFLRVGVRGKSAVDLARQLIRHFGSLNRMFAASEGEFSAIPGMGAAKYAQLQAVLEMARRALAETIRERDAFSSPAAFSIRLNGLVRLLICFATPSRPGKTHSDTPRLGCACSKATPCWPMCRTPRAGPRAGSRAFSCPDPSDLS